jgi:ribulose-phosphate 3-epimerase
MVSKPEFWVPVYAKAGANQFTFHYEATEDVADLIRLIRSHNMKVGIAIKPKTRMSILIANICLHRIPSIPIV